jgi:O-antigen/teichoic acid export membrane protein
MTEPSEGVPPSTSPGRWQQRAALGVALLAARTVAQQGAVLVGNVWLARALNPADFGLFVIVQFTLSVFAIMGDAGLGAALVQRKTLPTHRELSSIFWLQALIALGVIALVNLAAPLVPIVWPKLPSGSVWLLRALSFQLLLTAVRSVPSLLLERELHFGRVALVDFSMTIAFYATAVPLARSHPGTHVLVFAVLAQGIVATLLMAVLRPFRPALVLDVQLLRSFVRFGAAVQTKNVVGMVNEWLMPIIAGSFLGPTALGLINWSRQTSLFPYQFVSIVARVAFPLYSRLRDDGPKLGQAVERAAHVCAVFTACFGGLVLGLGEPLIRIIFSEKWMPALPLLCVYAGVHSFGFLTPVVAPAFDALGRPGLMTRLAGVWTAFNWIVATAAVWAFRTPLAFVVGACMHVLFSNVLVLAAYRRLHPHGRPLARVGPALLLAAALGVAGRRWIAPLVQGPLSLTAAIVGSIAGYVGLLYVVDGRARAEMRAAVAARAIFDARSA